jgi:hypothetical protein
MKLGLSWLILGYHWHEYISDGFAKNTRVPNSEFSIVRFTQAFFMDTMPTAVKFDEGSRRA